MACYVSYMTKTFGEAAFDLTGPSRQSGALALSDPATATLLSVGTGSYVAGKLLLGPVVDQLGGKKAFCGSLLVIALSFMGLSVSTKLPQLCAAWGLANFALAVPWSGMMLTCSPAWFTKLNGLGSVVAILSTASRAGVIVGNSIFGPMLRTRSWQRILQMAAVGYAVGAVVVAVCCNVPAAGAFSQALQPQKTAPQQPPPQQESERAVASTATLLQVIFTSPRVLLVFANATLLNPIFMFSSILPLYLVQAKGYTEAAAAAASSAFPVGAVASILLASRVWDQLKEKGRLLYCGCSLLVTLCATAAIGRGLVMGPRATFVALAAMTGGMSASWSIVGTEFVTTFGGSRAGTLTSWLDAPGYFLTTYFFATYSRVVSRGGWGALFFRLQVYVTLALACLSSFYLLELRKRTTGAHPRLAYGATTCTSSP